MAEPLTFFCYAFIVKKVHPWDDGRRVEATAMYALARATLAQPTFFDNWDDRVSYMIGLHVLTNQVVEVAYRGRTGGMFQLVQDAAVTQDLNTSLGAEPGRIWLGFVPPDSKPRRVVAVDSDQGTVSFDVELKIKPVPVAQFVPFAGRYRFDGGGKQGSFANGFMSGMWWVPKL
jgi:hypothetical protein